MGRQNAINHNHGGAREEAEWVGERGDCLEPRPQMHSRPNWAPSGLRREVRVAGWRAPPAAAAGPPGHRVRAPEKPKPVGQVSAQRCMASAVLFRLQLPRFPPLRA